MKFVVSKNGDKKEFYKVGNILLDEFFKLRAFQSFIVTYTNDFVIKSGVYVVNAKSLMGVFALDLSKKVELWSTNEDNTKLIEELKKYEILMED